MSTLFELQQTACRRGARQALSDISLRFSSGEFVALCGLNGAGKSTLLEIMAGVLEGYSGACLFEGREVRQWNPRLLARRISFLPQSTVAAARFTGAEVVRMGRHPFLEGFGENPADGAICREAMQMADCADLENRFIDEMSGGERQRVLLAAVLAQQPAALLLDEPGTFVDLPHQIRMFRLLGSLCAKGMLAIAATHDLNLAAAFATRIVLLDGGRVAADAPPAELLPSDAFRRIFGEHVRIDRAESGAVRVHYAI